MSCVNWLRIMRGLDDAAFNVAMAILVRVCRFPIVEAPLFERLNANDLTLIQHDQVASRKMFLSTELNLCAIYSLSRWLHFGRADWSWHDSAVVGISIEQPIRESDW